MWILCLVFVVARVWPMCERFLGLTGPVVWAHSTPQFTVYERNKEGRRVLNAMVLHVVFLLPPKGTDRLHLGVRTPVDVTGPQLVLFPVPHSRELRPESLEVTGMGLWLCGPQVVVLDGLHSCLFCSCGAAAGPSVCGCEAERDL
ncbi:hypothetical protein Taro_026250 [Colocasia esculenta]|uniref:Secreted protein n=1 Tax=Colocasia esculenta TaxID=4460 RepID=A0A843VN21_COLES|nr:hypothetical protein [Colocasia esculenta]